MPLPSIRSFLLACALSTPVMAQSPYPGQTLVATGSGTQTQLLELDGTVVQTWNGSAQPASCGRPMRK